MPFRFSVFFAFCLCFMGQSCGEANIPTASLNAGMIPMNAGPAVVQISDLNCWTEQGQFFVTGLCSNESSSWQKIWLKAVPRDAAGKAISIKGHASVVIPTFSSAVAPKGRTAFFAEWPLTDFQGAPVDCLVSGKAAITVEAGPILLVEQVSGVKMLAPTVADPNLKEEVAWQINAVLNNPMPLTAAHPQLELLLFGTDKKLWFATLLNPEDPQIKQMLSLERTGPMEPAEQRMVGVYAFYERLPQALKDKKIGRVELLAFDKR